MKGQLTNCVTNELTLCIGAFKESSNAVMSVIRSLSGRCDQSSSFQSLHNDILRFSSESVNMPFLTVKFECALLLLSEAEAVCYNQLLIFH